MTNYTIYALHLSTSPHLRYVGRTSRPVGERLAQHKLKASSGSSTPVHVWMREVGLDNISLQVLEATENGGEREAAWVVDLSSSGHDLLNERTPGTGGAGPWTEEQKAGVTGDGNPFFGRQHTDESRERMKASAPRISGPDHHLYGTKQDPEHVAKRIAKSAKARWTPEARAAAAEEFRRNNPMNDIDFSGENNPFFGKNHSDETRARMSEAAKNRPPVSDETREKMRLRNHNRWHRDRGITKPDCVFCT